MLGVATDSGTLSLHHAGGAHLGTLGDSDEEVLGFGFSSGSRYAVTGGTDRIVKIWDLKKKELIKRFRGFDDAVSCVSFSGGDTHVAAGSLAGEVRVFSILTGQPAGVVSLKRKEPLRALEYSPLRKALLAVGADDGAVHLLDATGLKVSGSFSQHQAPCSGLAFSPVNQLLLCSAGLDRRLFFYDINEAKVVKAVPTSAPLTSVTFLDDGITVAVGTSQGQVLSFDLRAGSAPTSEIQAFHGTQVSCVQFQATKAPKKGTSAERQTVSVSRTIAADEAERAVAASATSSASSASSSAAPSVSSSYSGLPLFSPMPGPATSKLPSVADLKSEAHAMAARGAKSPNRNPNPPTNRLPLPDAGDLFSPLPLPSNPRVTDPMHASSSSSAAAMSGTAASATTVAAAAQPAAGGRPLGGMIDDLFSPVGAPVVPRVPAAGSAVFDTPAAAPIVPIHDQKHPQNYLSVFDTPAAHGTASAGTRGLFETPAVSGRDTSVAPATAVAPGEAARGATVASAPVSSSARAAAFAPATAVAAAPPAVPTPAQTLQPPATSSSSSLSLQSAATTTSKKSTTFATGTAYPAAAAVDPQVPRKPTSARSLDLAVDQSQHPADQTTLSLTSTGSNARATSVTAPSRAAAAAAAAPPPPLATAAAPSGSSLLNSQPNINEGLLRSLLEDTIDVFRMEMHQAMRDMHLEIVRQFEVQRLELVQILESHERMVSDRIDKTITSNMSAPRDQFAFFFEPPASRK